MSQLHSRQSANSDEAGPTREHMHKAYSSAKLVPLVGSPQEAGLYEPYTDQFPIAAPQQGWPVSGRLSTEPLASVSGPLYDTRTTQSLVITLQTTLPRTGKTPLVIPGSRQRLRWAAQTEKLPSPRGLHPSIRLGGVLTATVSILLITLFSLSPLGKDQANASLFGGAIQWAQEQGITWNGIVSRVQQAEQVMTADVNKTTTAAAPPAPSNPPAPPNPAPAPNLPHGTYVDIARQAAVRYGIDPDNFVRQIQQESHFDPNAISPSGAVGIAQFIPTTAASLGVNPYDPVSALNGAARLMSSLAGQFGGDYAKALAAYNAGPGAVQSAVRAGGAAWLMYMPAETQHYVRTIMG